MMTSDGGQLIRMPVGGIAFVGRASQGVTLFKLSEGEKVVSVAHVAETGGEGEDGSQEEAQDGDRSEAEEPSSD